MSKTTKSCVEMANVLKQRADEARKGNTTASIAAVKAAEGMHAQGCICGKDSKQSPAASKKSAAA